jgi:eukaryotic-like serine/threonine-protein kinase
LFLDVCDAVSAAHRSLVVHRDLKPTNILVTRDGVVKLLDFGIARLIDITAADAAAAQTRTRAFTPDYASPEQVCGAPITTASDVYSLGAVLYELLTGRKPHQFTTDSPAEVERTVCERNPARPSAALGALVAADATEAIHVEQICRARHTRVDRLRRELAGDLDTIVLKALHKEAGRRYASADQLRQDIEHHLDDLPVAARPDSVAYRARKFVMRHRTAVLAAALLVVSVVAGAAGTLVQARRAEEQRAVAARERDRARVEAARAARVTTLLADVFTLADPAQAQASTITAREMLDRGSARLERELASDPATQAAMFDAIGRVYQNLGLFEPADRLLQRSLAQRETIYGPASREVAGTLESLGTLHFQRSEYQAGEERFRRALAIRRAPGATPLELTTTLEGLGQLLGEAGKVAEAERVMREALAIRRTLGDESERARVLQQLALIMHVKGDYGQAEALFRDAVQVARASAGPLTPSKISGVLHLARLEHLYDHAPAIAEPHYREAVALARALYAGDHPELATCLNELSRVVRDLGRLGEAEALAREALAMWRRLFGDRNRETMVSVHNLAEIVEDRRRFREAERLYRSALSIGHQLFGQRNQNLLGVKAALALFLEKRTRFREAEVLRRAELEDATTLFGADSVYAARALSGLGGLRLAEGALRDAETCFRRALDIRRRVHPPGHWRIAEASSRLGESLARARRFAEAESLLRDAYAWLQTAKGAPPAEARATRTRLVTLYEAWDRPADAARYQAP